MAEPERASNEAPIERWATSSYQVAIKRLATSSTNLADLARQKLSSSCKFRPASATVASSSPPAITGSPCDVHLVPVVPKASSSSRGSGGSRGPAGRPQGSLRVGRRDH